ncbi:MAG: polysaccharide deacetylase family protein [Acetobacteraceae bacterium]
MSAQIRTAAFPEPAPALPPPGQLLVSLIVDAEEDFNWSRPIEGTDYTTACMHAIGPLQELLSAYTLPPTYLLTYPVLEDADAVRLLRRQHERGRCALGVQMHPWVNPPFGTGMDRRLSFPLNLPAAVQEAKIVQLAEKFAAVFGFAPRVFKAWRYGIGAQTVALLERLGFLIDTSVAPRTDLGDEGGPDFSAYDVRPFWFGTTRRLLELPVCRDVVGWAGAAAPRLYRPLAGPNPSALRAVLSWLRLAERITLSPEGNDTAAMRRLIRGQEAAGQRVLTVSFHSSSLAVGHNPYVQSQKELHMFYDRLSAVLDGLARRPETRFAGVPELVGLLAETPPQALEARPC